MSKIQIKVTADVSVIKSQLRKDEKFSQGIRLHAVYQIAQGKTAKELEDIYSTSHKSICNWVHRYNSEGISGLTDKPRSGRLSRINEEQKSILLKAVLDSPEKEGFNSGVWTWALVAAYLKRKFDIEYKRAHIYNILHSMGLTYQKGKGGYFEIKDRDATVNAIKKTSVHRRK
jgi:transposase